MTSKNKQKKINIVSDLTCELFPDKDILIFDYQGLSAVELNLLRQKITAGNNTVKAIKKNLLKIALSESGQKELASKDFPGQTAIALVSKNSLETIKEINLVSKSLGKLNFLAGLFEGRLIDQNEFLKLATLPGREQLIAMAISLIKNPINRLVMQTKVNQQRLVLTLKAAALRR